MGKTKENVLLVGGGTDTGSAPDARAGLNWVRPMD